MFVFSPESWAKSILGRAGISINGRNPYDLQVKDSRVFRRVAFGGIRSLGNAYVDGQWECDSLDEFFARTSSLELQKDLPQLLERFSALRDWVLNTQSVRRALEVGRKHYDLGNELYRYMLGDTLSYSSAFFGEADKSLDEAQIAKFEKICKTLELRPGMRVLEIGCGWGTFAKYAAHVHRVEVVGISISKEQLVVANEGRHARTTFHFMDYRKLPAEWLGTFDAVVSVEMIEAVGARNLRAYFDSASRALKPKGKFLLQAIIGTGVPDEWISIYIFPNGVLPSVSQIGNAIENRFDIRRWDTFGSDYDRTLMEWHKRFVRFWPQIKEMKDTNGQPKYDERFYRMWRYYLLLCAGIFRSRYINVAQILLERRG